MIGALVYFAVCVIGGFAFGAWLTFLAYYGREFWRGPVPSRHPIGGTRPPMRIVDRYGSGKTLVNEWAEQ